MAKRISKPAEEQLRPSGAFAKRLRETRMARRLSQTELAHRLTEEGQPMSKAALLRIENGERGLSLDEALALAAVLHAVPAHLLTPPDDGIVWLTEKQGVDGAGLRAWLLHGDDFVATWGDYQHGEREKELGRVALVHAQALVDAHRGGDKAGSREALRMLLEIGKAHRKELEHLDEQKESK